MKPDLTIYFDESGYTGEDLCNPEQRNLLLAGIAVSAENDAFWNDLSRVWSLMKNVLRAVPNTAELKGSDLYGGKGHFKEVPLEDRLSIIELVVGIIIKYQIEILWDGLPKHLWRDRVLHTNTCDQEKPFWESVLFAFCSELHDVATSRYDTNHIRIIGDENSWKKAGDKLTLNHPCKLEHPFDLDVSFRSSSRTKGLQLADLLVHTLYRSNKCQVPDPQMNPPKLSNTDRHAERFHRRIARYGLWVNLTEEREQYRN